VLDELAKDSAIGWGIFAASVLGVILYGALMVYAWEITIRVTAFLAVALLLGILAWIGYTMATTPPPEPIADIPTMKTEVPPSSSSGSGTTPTETKKQTSS
jgi:predicted DNA-binding transcriptional regulator